MELKTRAEVVKLTKKIDPKKDKKWTCKKEEMKGINRYWDTYSCDGVPVIEVSNETGKVVIKSLVK